MDAEGIHNDPAYVSFGKCVANFVAAPLIATGEYSEIQMFFYPLNSAAGGARIYTTASLPLKKDEIDVIFEATPDKDGKVDDDKESIKLGTISAKVMFDKLASLTNSLDLDAYGLSSVSVSTQKSDLDKEFKLAKKNKSKREDYLLSYFKKTHSKDDSKNELSKYNKEKNKDKKDNMLKRAVANSISTKATENRSTILKEIYKHDGLGGTDSDTFRYPAISMHLEVVSPIMPIGDPKVDLGIRAFGAQGKVYNKSEQTEYGNGRILRIHIVDAANIGNPKLDLANQVLYGGKKNVSKSVSTAEILTNGINNLSDGELKEYIKRHYTTIIYGAGSSTVKSVNVSSTTSDRIAQAKMMTFEKNRRAKSISKNVNTLAESVRMVPASIDMQILGCPLIERGSTIFVDMGTNTDLDNCYVVNSVTHSISKGDFTTSLGLVVGNQGTVINARGSLLQKLDAIVNPDTKLKKE